MARRNTGSNMQRLVDLDAVWQHRTPAASSFTEVFRTLGESAAPAAQLDAWLALQGGALPGRKLVNGLRWLGLLVTLFGIVLGAGFMQVLVAYDGSLQVNVLWIIALTLVQTLLCLLAAIVLLRKPQPRVPVLSDLVGHWPRWLTGIFQPLLSAPFQEATFWKTLHQPWLLREAQRLGFWFALSAFVVLCVHVVVEDLAFGWATTLSMTPEFLHRVVGLLATPWQFWQTAVPGIELVEQSQFFRLQGASSAADAQLLAQWWPFLAALWLVYALLPRTLLWLLAEWRWRAALERALLQHPRYAETLSGFRFDHWQAARQSAEILAAMLAEVLSHREMRTVAGLDQAQLRSVSQQLMEGWKNHIAGAERRAWQAVAELYLQQRLDDVAEPEWPQTDALFAVDEWERWGLNRKKLALLAGLGGAGTGAAIDVATGGLTMGAASAVLGLAAGVGVYASSAVAEQVADAGQVRVGPAKHKNFPWVMVGRSVSAWTALVSRLPGSRRLPQDFPDWREQLSGKQQRELKQVFALLRDKKDMTAAEARLVATLQDILLNLIERSSRPSK